MTMFTTSKEETMAKQNVNACLQSILFCSTMSSTFYRGPKKVSHYQESRLNSIKNRQQGQIFHQF